MAQQSPTRASVDLLDALHKVVLDYGVRKVEKFPFHLCLEITYHAIGQGSALSSLISDKISEVSPDMSYRIKMIPTDKMLIVSLL